MDDKISSFIQPAKLWSRSEVLSDPCPVPAKPGAYAWFFKDIPPQVPVTGCITWLGLTLLYVGISPAKRINSSGKPSRQNLRKRIRSHFRGNAYGSTLRLTLGCLLKDELDIRLKQLGERRIHFAEGEHMLSEWMGANAFVTWVVQEEPWLLEDHLIKILKPPLNLQGNENHPFYSTLSQIRKLSKQKAKRDIHADD